MQSSFLCTRVSGYYCNLCVCLYMWSEFYRAWWLGHLDQFLECFSVFFCIFSAFLPWNRLPEFFCASRSLFSVFSRTNWRHFAVALCCCPTCVCWPVRPCLFKFFSMPPTRLTLHNQSADLLLAASMSLSLWLSNKIAIALAYALHQSEPTFVTGIRA